MGDPVFSSGFNIYFLIASLGLFLKLIVARQALRQSFDIEPRTRLELHLFVVCFLVYSLVQMLLFSPVGFKIYVGVEQLLIVKAYYFVDGLCLLFGMYILLSILGHQDHRKACVQGLLLTYILGVSVVLFASDALVSNQLDGPDRGPLGLGAGFGGWLLPAIRIIIFMIIAVLCYALYRLYKNANEEASQIKSLYCLLAGLVYSSNCLLGLYKVMPLNISVRGTLFFVVVMILIRKQHFFDLRQNAPGSSEHATVLQYKEILNDYLMQRISHKQAMLDTEKALLSYKINKAATFHRAAGSALPRAAESMGISLGSVYNLMKKHQLVKPKNN